ncbi:MAG: (2Fe-2S) ferredoxin domain-containing protein [Clostridia bacterium]|nr:(2Fe-2S) ferredoxin domain-containing protein [Clostridia bacterium]
MIIQICIGSSCHLKGSEQLVKLFQDAVQKYDLDKEVALAGSFCTGKCNRVGVTVQVDDEIYTGITPEEFNDFFRDKVLIPLGRESE